MAAIELHDPLVLIVVVVVLIAACLVILGRR